MSRCVGKLACWQWPSLRESKSRRALSPPQVEVVGKAAIP